MQDVAHHQHVGLGQRVGEEVAGGEAQAVAEPEAGDVLVEDRLDGRQVEAAAGEVRVGQRELHRHGALGAADVDTRAVILPTGTWPRSPAPAPRLTPVIARSELRAAAPGRRRAPRRSRRRPCASFCGWPVRRPSVSEPQKRYSRALAISSMPPTYDGLARSRKRSVSGVLG